MKALLVLKDLQPNRPDKATYLANHKKTGLWPWIHLSASPHTVLFRWKSFLDHVDHAAWRAPGRWTTARPRKGMTRSRGRRDSGCPRGEVYEGSMVRLRVATRPQTVKSLCFSVIPGSVMLTHTVLVRWKSFLDHVDHAAPRAPGRWTTARPRKGMTRSRGRRNNGCPHGEEYEGSLVRLPSP